MTSLAEQWRAVLDAEPSDWSHLSLELRLGDTERTEDACVVLSPLNPWRDGDDFRSGLLRFRAARQHGYGSASELVSARMRMLDEHGIAGTLRVLRKVDAARLVSTQGPR
jgi:hypothetical protein